MNAQRLLSPLDLRNRLAGRLDDHGSGAGAVIIFAFLFLTLSAFVVDSGLLISQRERAADIAEEAARYAAQDLDEEALYEAAPGEGGGGGEEGAPPTGDAPIRFANCDSRVSEYIAELGKDVSAARCYGDTDADSVEVEITLTYHPVFLSGTSTVVGTAHAEPRVAPGN